MAHTNLRLLSQELQLFFSWRTMIVIVNREGDFNNFVLNFVRNLPGFGVTMFQTITCLLCKRKLGYSVL